jgi:phosphate transport system substrate-binding protein
MQFRGKQVAAASGAVAAAIALAACSSSSSSSSSSAPAASSSSSAAASSSAPASTSSASGTISGAGSTFQTNFQQGAISAFKSVDSGITVNYNPVGSGTGRTDLYANSVLYAGSDSPIPSKEAGEVPKGKTVLYFPVQIGPIAMAYNVSGVTDLKLDATVLAGIFSGKITTWNDPAIKALNPSASLPSASINLEVRSDSSGTTANFSQYLVPEVGPRQ